MPIFLLLSQDFEMILNSEYVFENFWGSEYTFLSLWINSYMNWTCSFANLFVVVSSVGETNRRRNGRNRGWSGGRKTVCGRSSWPFHGRAGVRMMRRMIPCFNKAGHCSSLSSCGETRSPCPRRADARLASWTKICCHLERKELLWSCIGRVLGYACTWITRAA